MKWTHASKSVILETEDKRPKLEITSNMFLNWSAKDSLGWGLLENAAHTEKIRLDFKSQDKL